MTHDETHTDQPRNLPSKRFVALLYIPLTLPAAIPLYMARSQDDPVILAIMIGTTIVILFGNAGLLVLLYRWFAGSTSP